MLGKLDTIPVKDTLMLKSVIEEILDMLSIKVFKLWSQL